MKDNNKNKDEILIVSGVIVCLAVIGFITWLLIGRIRQNKEDELLMQSNTSVNETEELSEETVEAPEEAPEETQVQPPQDDGTWTVMVYMCGTDLESKFACGTMNLYEMMLAKKTDQVNVLVNTGGTGEWHINDDADDLEQFPGIDKDTLGYYHVVNEDIILDKTEPLASMGEPETLKNFITWGTGNYPADKYMLIFWDHGGGSIGGVCKDELFSDDTLSLTEIREAVRTADVPLEAIGFDACLMATLETAEAIQGYGHYMIASEESEPGGGWDYQDFLDYLCNAPGMGGDELGKRIADGYMEKCKSSGEDSTCTLSVIDLTRIPALSSAYRGLSGEILLSTQDSASFTSVHQGATRAVNYGGNTDSEGYTNMVDLGDLINQTGEILSKNSGDVKAALKEAVKYEIHGENREGSNGLSVFYPLGFYDDTVETYSQITDNTAFVEYTSIISGDFDSAEWEEKWKTAWEEAYSEKTAEEGKYDSLFAEAGEPAPESTPPAQTEEYYETLSNLSPIKEEDHKVEFTEGINDNGYHSLKITSGLDVVSEVSFQLYYEIPETGEYMYLGSDNNLISDWDAGVFEDNFEGSWITIGGEFVYAELIGQTDTYNLYSVPVLLNGEEKHLRAVYDYGKEQFRVLGVRDGLDDETGQYGRDEKLKDGDKLEFLFYVYNTKSDSEEIIQSGSIEWRNNTVMEDTFMDDDRFLYLFKIKDVFGHEYYGEPVYMEIKNGEISAYEP